jgi:hypothetical protein
VTNGQRWLYARRASQNDRKPAPSHAPRTRAECRQPEEFIEKSRARLKELEELKLANPAVPDLAIEMERKHLRECEEQLVALSN